MLFRRRSMACRQAVGLMTDYLDGALSEQDRTRFERHLLRCPHCSEYLAQMRATIDAAGHVEPEDLSAEALDDLVRLYRRWRDD